MVKNSLNNDNTRFENEMNHLLDKLNSEMNSFGGYPNCKQFNSSDIFLTGPFMFDEEDFNSYLSRLNEFDYLKRDDDYFFYVDDYFLLVITKKKNVSSKSIMDAMVVGPSEDFYIKYRRHDSDKIISDIKYEGALVSTICNGDLNSISDDYFYSWDPGEIPSVIDIGDILNKVSFDYLKSKISINRPKIKDRALDKKESN